uniref:Tripartite motif-containing protein 45-like n=1 Tax=Saccoglossus kowalevskii TaxID=10224 RepID=A0ABM0M457_SACKO|nr:PREDICTED: tripartite motif-containing protein 45-like [Saccoglossus kowalevskii]
MGCGSSAVESRPVTPAYIPPPEPRKEPRPEPVPQIIQNECGFCKRHEASGFCSDCGVLICQSCAAHHRDANLLKKHAILTLGEYKDNITTFSRFVRPVICPMHNGHEMTFYCLTCSLPICMICAEYVHKKPRHQHTTLIEGLSTKQKELKSQVEILRTRKKDLEDMRMSLDEENRQYLHGDGQVDPADAIKENTQKLRELIQKALVELQKNSTNLLQQVEKAKKTNSKKSETKCVEIKELLLHIDKQLHYTNALMVNSNDIGFLLAVNQIVTGIQTTLAKQIEKPTPVTIRFVPNEDVFDAIKKNQVGKVQVTGLQDDNPRVDAQKWRDFARKYKQTGQETEPQQQKPRERPQSKEWWFKYIR